MKHTKQLFLLLLLAIVSNVAAWGQKTYKLEQVTEVQGAAMYVFEQGGYVMNNTVSSNALQTTNSYLTTGLTGSESYVWKLETNGTGYKMRNMSLNAANAYLRNSSSTNVSFGNVSADNNTWIFSFAEGTVLIQNKDNGNRFLGYTSSTSHAYKAYAASNLSSYPHAIKVYKLVEETAAFTIEAISNDNSYGTVSLSGNTITATPATGYQVSTTNSYTVTSGTATVEQDGNTFTVTPSENCTVQINFEAIPTKTYLYIKSDNAPNVYAYIDDTHKLKGDWPGSQVSEETVTEHGHTWYKMDIDSDNYYLILNYEGGQYPASGQPGINITGDTYLVYNSAEDGTSTSYAKVVNFAEVTAESLSLTEGETGNSTISSTPSGLAFTYSSDNTSVATVSNDGTVSAIGGGNCNITVSWATQEVGGAHYISGSTTFTVNVTEAETERTYVKVTSTDDIEDGKKYLIVYEEGSVAFDGSLSTLDAASNNQEVVINNGTIKTDANIFFTISGGTILSASGKYIGKDASGNGLDVSSSSLINEISISDGNVIIKGLGGSYLKFNDASNQNRFRYYGSGQKAIQLYKEESVTQEVNIYVKSDSAPYVYTWTGEGSSKTEHMGSWPGTKTTETEDVNGITWHKITVHAKGFNLILSKGKDQPQTENINNITEDKYIVWNSEADGYEATQTPTPYLFVGFGGVTAENKTVKVGNTTASSVTPEGFQLSYQSDNTNIATVSNDGTITGVSEGTATITVSWNTQEVGGQGYLAGSTTFTVTVTAAPSGDVFVKATSENDLQDGMQVIIVNDTYGNVMGEQSTKNFGVATVEIDKNTSPYEATPGEHATILTLEGSTGAWYFKDEQGKYLYAASSSSNYLRTQSESDKTNNAKATITISGDNSDAAIKFQGDHTHNIIRYNGTEQGSGIFSCYTSGQKPVQIYYRASQTIVARPTIDPATGTYNEAQTVTITNNAEGATVYYTTDGSTPTAESTQYTAPFVLRQNGTHTIKAIAIGNDGKSSVATSTITINIEIDAPVISPENGTQITEETSISITAEGLTIYYTTDGSDPVKDGALTGTAKAYTGEFTLTKAGTVKAVARDAGGNFSEIVSATYTYNGTVTAPYYENFDEGLGNFTVEQTGTVPPKWIFQTTTNEATYGTRKYAFVNGSNKQGTTRLVSPVIDLTDETIQNVTLSFVHAGRYFDGYNAPSYTSEQTAAGNAPTHAQVFVREENGTWQQVTIPNWFTQAGSNDPNIYERINSGEIPLDDYKGKKIQVSFLYTADGSNEGSNSTGIWNVLKFALTTTEAEVENYEIVEMKTDGFVTYVVQNDIDVAKTLENNTKEEGANVHVYKVTEFSKTDAVFGEFGYGDNETVIPAETPVIIKGTRGVNKLVIAKGGDIIAKPANNLLLPSYGDVAPTDEQHLLVFQKTSDWNEAEPYSNYAFFKLKTGRTIPNRKAYLNGTDFKESITTQTNPAKGVFLMEDLDMDYEIPLGVETVNTTNRAQNTGIFDLMGRKVADKAENVSAAVLQKGVYIVNGRKVVIK